LDFILAPLGLYLIHDATSGSEKDGIDEVCGPLTAIPDMEDIVRRVYEKLRADKIGKGVKEEGGDAKGGVGAKREHAGSEESVPEGEDAGVKDSDEGMRGVNVGQEMGDRGVRRGRGGKSLKSGQEEGRYQGPPAMVMDQGMTLAVVVEHTGEVIAGMVREVEKALGIEVGGWVE
jgi:hypothetical protein